MAGRPSGPGASQSETSTDMIVCTSLSPNTSRGTSRQKRSWEMLVSAHSVSMWIACPCTAGMARVR